MSELLSEIRTLEETIDNMFAPLERKFVAANRVGKAPAEWSQFKQIPAWVNGLDRARCTNGLITFLSNKRAEIRNSMTDKTSLYEQETKIYLDYYNRLDVMFKGMHIVGDFAGDEV